MIEWCSICRIADGQQSPVVKVPWVPNERWCMSKQACGHHYLCTRPRGHHGRHAAAKAFSFPLPSEVLAVWK